MTVQTAAAFAERKHAGQLDKNGRPYIEHVLRVAARMEGDTEKIVALLHDVLEDTDATIDELCELGADDEVIEAVSLLRHTHGTSYPEYIMALAQHPLARAVKLADIADNSDEARLSSLSTETHDRLVRKYQQALEILRATAGE